MYAFLGVIHIVFLLSFVGLAFCFAAFIIIKITNLVFKKVKRFKEKGLELKMINIRWIAPALSFIYLIYTQILVRTSPRSGMGEFFLSIIGVAALICTTIVAALIGRAIKKREKAKTRD